MGIFNFGRKKSVTKVTCRCGHKFEVDWEKFPKNVKTTYLQCPKCYMELKVGNQNYRDDE